MELSLWLVTAIYARVITLTLHWHYTGQCGLFFLSKQGVLEDGSTDHINEASRMLVLLASGSIGASAMMTPERTAPPKQYSMALNQQANGLRRDTSNAPVKQQTNITLKRRTNRLPGCHTLHAWPHFRNVFETQFAKRLCLNTEGKTRS